MTNERLIVKIITEIYIVLQDSNCASKLNLPYRNEDVSFHLCRQFFLFDYEFIFEKVYIYTFQSAEMESISHIGNDSEHG